MEGEVRSGYARWWVALVGAMVVLGLGCARQTWKREDVMTWEGCCEGAAACFALLQDVHGPDSGEKWLPPEQSCAAWKLGQLGEAVVPRLVPLLRHADRRVRGGAAQGLAGMGEKAKAAVPALVEAYVREPNGLALHALSSLDDARAAPAIVRNLLASPMSTLEHLGPTLAPVLVEVLENPESSWEELARVRYVLARRTVTHTEAFAPRLRSLLARELAEPALRRPPGTSCPVPPAPGCEVVYDGCTPRAAYVASVLAAYERDGVEAAPEMLLALRRGDARLTPVALQALVAFDSPTVVPEVLQQLANPECRARALASLAFLGPVARPAATEPLLRLLASGVEGWERARAAEALGRLGDPTAVEALRKAVSEPHSEVQAAAVWALGNHAFQAHWEALSPLFQQVLREHPSPVARNHARWALQCLEGKAARPADSSAPTSVLSGRGPEWRMCQGDTSIQLQWDKPQAPSKEGPCADVSDADSASVLEVVGAACLVGRDAGEFGGTLEVHEAGRVTVLEEPRANPLSAVRVHGALVVVEGLSHLFGGEGRLVRVETSEGRWRATPWVELPGAPLALGLDDEGNLVMGTTEQRLDEIFCAEPRASSLVHALRITEDGRLVPLAPGERP